MISLCQLVCAHRGAREMHTFRTTSLFQQMVRIGTPINKPTPQSIVTSFASSFFLVPSLFSFSVFRSSFLFRSLPFLFLFRCSSARRRFSSLFFRPLFYHVQGKPINYRIPSVYCETPGCRLKPATSPAFLYSASRPFA